MLPGLLHTRGGMQASTSRVCHTSRSKAWPSPTAKGWASRQGRQWSSPEATRSYQAWCPTSKSSGSPSHTLAVRMCLRVYLSAAACSFVCKLQAHARAARFGCILAPRVYVRHVGPCVVTLLPLRVRLYVHYKCIPAHARTHAHMHAHGAVAILLDVSSSGLAFTHRLRLRLRVYTAQARVWTCGVCGQASATQCCTTLAAVLPLCMGAMQPVWNLGTCTPSTTLSTTLRSKSPIAK